MGRLVELKKSVSKANRDENSSPGATIVIRHPDGRFKAKAMVAHTRTGAFEGKTRGVGRHLTRDENSTPGCAVVRTPTLREINGKFAGQGYGVKVFHPGTGKRSAVHSHGVFRTTKGSAATVAVKKGDERKGMLGPVDMASMQLHAGVRVGRRIPG